MRATKPSRQRGSPLAAAGFAIFGILVLSLNWSCSPRRLVASEMTSLMEAGAASMEQDDDLEMLQQALPANLKLMEALLASDPKNQRLLVLLARLYASYAFLFIEGRIDADQWPSAYPQQRNASREELRDTAVRLYTKGKGYALQALAVDHPHAAAHLSKVTQSDAFIRSLQGQDMGALFWYGFNLSGLINHNRDSVELIAQAHLVERSMKRVLALEPQFYHGTAHLVLLAYYASRSPLMGGNLSLAEKHYQQLKALHGDRLLLTDLFFARYYLVQLQDRRRFEQVLTAVVDSSDSDARFRMLNRVARDRARIYLSKADYLFPQG